MRSVPVNHQIQEVECTETCGTVRWLGLVLAVLVLLLWVGVGRADAHRLSGHPESIAGKLKLAKRQVAHDRLTGDPSLGQDRRYVAELKRALGILGRPPHYRGWLCIHRGEAAWNDKGHPYYGGLQMSWNWMRAVPGGDAGRLSPMRQMWIAERVSARHGFSWSWMQGQWPHTFPPCAGWF